VMPILDVDQRSLGLVLAFHLLNNDFTLVDQIKAAAEIDTVTIFLGDLRVSTNVMSAENQRAVGTRLAEDVSNIVLRQGQPYVGTAFVVNENYITRYEPLRDEQGQVVGVLYVGARQAAFQRLLNTVDQRITLIATLTILLTFILATPVSRIITRPLKELRQLARTSRRVAGGDLNARAPVFAKGEVGQLATDFNYMLDTLQATKDQLVHSENLAAIGQLAAGVAHELNNPLGTVLLYADTLLRENDEQDQHRSDLQVIVREIQRCKSIVAALLDFARQRQSTVQDVDLNELVLSILEVEKIHPRYQAVHFVIELDPNLPRIQADPTQLREVFLNLLTNAAEAMPDGGQLTLRTIADPPEMVTIVVSDTGVGISKENLGRIFTPFFTTKPVGKGTGLGLAITYGIVKLHRGQIDVKSRIGEGTTFTIGLPRRSPGFGGSMTDQSAGSGAGRLIGEQEHHDEHPK
jgi:two-component system NtrC family sensor kinase